MCCGAHDFCCHATADFKRRRIWAAILKVRISIFPFTSVAASASQLVYRLFFESATQDEHCESPLSRTLDPRCHRLGNAGVAAVPHWIQIRAPNTNSASERQVGSLKRRFEKENAVTESWELPEFWEFNEGTHRIACSFILSCLIFQIHHRTRTYELADFWGVAAARIRGKLGEWRLFQWLIEFRDRSRWQQAKAEYAKPHKN
jgi:hypothetical protein